MTDKGKSTQKKRASSASTQAQIAGRTGSGANERRGNTAGTGGGIEKRAAPKQLEARFRAVFESSRDAIGVSKAGIHVFVNPAYLELFGIAPGTDLAGRPILDLIAQESRAQINENIRLRVRGESAPSTYETCGLRTDGSVFDMEVKASHYQENGEDLTLVILRDIAERKRSEREIAERGILLQQIMDTADVAIFLVDLTGRITHANRRMAEMFGRALKDINGSEYVSLVHASERESGRQKMLALLASRIDSVDLERLYQRGDGTEFWGHLAGRRFYDALGRELGLIGVITDITERKKTEERIRKSEQYFRAIFEGAGEGIAMTGVATKKIVYANPAFSQMYGYTMEELTSLGVEDLHPPDVVQRAVAEFEAKVRGEKILASDLPCLRKDGTVFYADIKSTPVEIGGRTFLVGFFTDITERKQTESALKQSEEKFRRLYNETPVLLHSIDRAGILIDVNDYWLNTMGYERNEVIGRNVTDFFTEASRKYAREVVLSEFFREGIVTDIPYQLVKKNGDVLDVLLSATGERDSAGNVVRSQAVIEDISDRKRAEEALRRSEARYRALYEGTPVMMHSIDAEGKLISVSDHWLRTLGYAREEVLGKRSTEFLDEQSRIYAQTEVLHAFMQMGICTDVPYTFIKKNGERIFTLLSAIAERDDAGKVKRSLAVIIDITERKRAEDQLRESESRFRDLAESLPLTVFEVDLRGRFTFVNKAAMQTFGYSQKDFDAGVWIDQVIVPEDRDRARVAMARRLQGIVDGFLEYRGLRKDGTAFPITVASAPILLDGTYVGLRGIVTDLTERKRAEETLRKSEEKYRSLFDNSAVAMFRTRLDGSEVLDVNQKWLDLVGTTREEALGKPSVLDWEDPKERERMVRMLIADGSVSEFEFNMLSRQRGVRHCVTSLRLYRDQGILEGSVADITERKHAEDALRESESRFRRLVEQSPLAITIIDSTGRVEYINKKHIEIVGYLIEEIPTLDAWWGRAYPEQETRQRIMIEWSKLSRRIFSGEDVEPVERTIVCKDGSRREVEMRFSPVNDKILVFFIDITERKKTEDALRENKERLDLALQSAHMGVWFWAIKEDRRFFDDLTCQLLGINAATFTGTVEEFFHVVHLEDRGKVKEAIDRTLEQDVPYEPAYRVVWQDGSIRHLTARGRLVRDNKGRPEKLHGVLWDVTDQYLLEQELIKTHKLESIGTLAGGIAHDFNNLLQGVFGFISMARLTFDEKEKSLAMLTQAEKALHQSVNLTTQLLTFAKGGKPLKKFIDLRSVIANSVAFALSGSHNTYETDLGDSLPTVEADEGQIGQVIQNIVLNADQAMPLGGMIRVSVRTVDAAAIVPPVDMQRDLVEIAIRDQGTGIPAEHLARIFDPYFTTKEKGSGLGLATSYSIIKNHGGVLRAKSEIGKGTTFFIYLPASGAPHEELARPAVIAATRTARVLVMDDEEMIRSVAGALLAAVGHEAAFTENGEAALKAYQAARDKGRPFDIVILDLTVRGGMGGVETLKRLKEIDPDVKAVASSGYSDDAAYSNYQGLGFRDFLKKPYDISELQRALNALLT